MADLVNELAGKVAVVTGSARNIGRATALELARAGAALVINARQSKDLCEEVAHEIVSAGGRAIPVVADITDENAVARMVGAARDAFGGIDIVVNNAAVRGRKPFVELDRETWEQSLGAGFHVGGIFKSAAAAGGLLHQYRMPVLLHDLHSGRGHGYTIFLGLNLF